MCLGHLGEPGGQTGRNLFEVSYAALEFTPQKGQQKVVRDLPLQDRLGKSRVLCMASRQFLQPCERRDVGGLGIEERGQAVVQDLPGIEYDEFDTFVSHLAYEGLDDDVRLHKDRGLPQDGFSEAYIRNARALLQVGPADPADLDRPTGMPLGLFALQNPFVERVAELEVQFLWQGAPVPNRQVSVFQRSTANGTAGDVTRTLVITDAAGKAAIPLTQDGFYLLNAVQMKPVAGDDGFVWESHWATLTFAVEGP